MLRAEMGRFAKFEAWRLARQKLSSVRINFRRWQLAKWTGLFGFTPFRHICFPFGMPILDFDLLRPWGLYQGLRFAPPCPFLFLLKFGPFTPLRPWLSWVSRKCIALPVRLTGRLLVLVANPLPMVRRKSRDGGRSCWMAAQKSIRRHDVCDIVESATHRIFCK